MDKTLEKITKDPKRVEAARKGREKYMNKLKESVLNDAKKGRGDTTNANNETTNASNETTTPATSTKNTTTTTRLNDIYISMALVCLLCLPLVFVYFLNITLPRLKIKNSSMKKKINHQKDVICFRKIYNK